MRARFKALGEAGRLQPGTAIPPPAGVFPRYVEPGTETDEPKAKKPKPQKKTCSHGGQTLRMATLPEPLCLED